MPSPCSGATEVSSLKTMSIVEGLSTILSTSSGVALERRSAHAPHLLAVNVATSIAHATRAIQKAKWAATIEALCDAVPCETNLVSTDSFAMVRHSSLQMPVACGQELISQEELASIMERQKVYRHFVSV